MPRTHLALPALLLLLAGTATAHAGDSTSDRGRLRGAMPAIDDAIELAVGVGVARSEGDLGGAMDAGVVVGTAAELELAIGRRITPNLALSFYLTAQDEGAASVPGRSIHTGSAGVKADFHLRPTLATDPWLSVGAGLRALLTVDDGAELLIGAELARVQLGVDLRMSESISIAPMIGASASLYGAQRTPMDGFSELSDKGIAWTFTAGVAGRFDLGGTRR